MFTPTKLTEEELAIDEAIDAHRDARKDEKQSFILAFCLYFAGLLLNGISKDGTLVNRVSTALLVCAVVVFIVHLLLGYREYKYRMAAKDLVDPYLRKKALPFYQELTELFANKPGLHLHLEQDGRITVTDKRKKEK